MSIAKKLQFTKPQLRKFAKLLRKARIDAEMTQLQVAQAAFAYRISHCKVSRVERAVMPKVDAHCIELMAKVLSVPSRELQAIDPLFHARAIVARAGTRAGLWDAPALLMPTPAPSSDSHPICAIART